MVSFLAAAVERHALKCCVPDMRPVSLLSSLLLATQRTRASMPHRGSKETILSESRDVAKRKKDSMTAIFPLYWDKSAHHEIRDFYAHMALMDEHRFARYFCRYIENIARQYSLYNKNIWANKKARVASFLRLRAVFYLDLT